MSSRIDINQITSKATHKPIDASKYKKIVLQGTHAPAPVSKDWIVSPPKPLPITVDHSKYKAILKNAYERLGSSKEHQNAFLSWYSESLL